GEAGAEPAARRPDPEFRDDGHRLVDHGFLVVELVHRHLVEAVRVELPARLDTGLRDLRIGLAHARIERDGWRDLQRLEHALEPPEGDAHAVLVPAPVRMVRQHRLALRRRDHHARHRAGHVPFLEREQRPHDHAQAAGQLGDGACLDRRIGEAFAWMHGNFLGKFSGRSVGRVSRVSPQDGEWRTKKLACPHRSLAVTNFPDMLARFAAAVEANEGSGLAALFTDDGVYEDGFFGAFTGPAAIAKMLAHFPETAEDFRWEFFDPV